MRPLSRCEIASVLLFASVSIAVAEPVAIGQVTTAMSFDEIERTIGVGERKCDMWSGEVAYGCTLTVKLPSETYRISKTPEGRTKVIDRDLAIPDALTIDDVFDQLRERYGGPSEYGTLPSVRQLFLLCEEGDCVVRKAKIEAAVLEDSDNRFVEKRYVSILYVDWVLMAEEQDRMDREVRDAKPKLPL